MNARLMRYLLAIGGPVASAGSQFLLSLAFLRLLTPALFGSFSFLIVVSILSWGLWSALFCAPLPLLLSSREGAQREAVLRCLFSANLAVALAAFIPFLVIAIKVGLPITPALLYALYATVSLLRWFARTYVYANGGQWRTTLSDITYGVVLLIGTGVALLFKEHALTIAYVTLALSAIAGLCPFGAAYLREQFTKFDFSSLRRYGEIWRSYSGWSLLGVLTTETTANSHAYLVTGLFGPAAFAPIAASALMIRPINVAMNALSDFERAQMARSISSGEVERATRSVHLFRLVLVLIWLATAAMIVALLNFAPHIIFPAQYSLSFLTTAAALWMAVTAVRLSRTPESALLQAAGQFRPLAMASVMSSGVSLVAVLTCLLSFGTLWSIAGILLGEAIYAFWIFYQSRKWRRSSLSNPPPPSTAEPTT